MTQDDGGPEAEHASKLPLPSALLLTCFIPLAMTALLLVMILPFERVMNVPLQMVMTQCNVPWAEHDNHVQ